MNEALFTLVGKIVAGVLAAAVIVGVLYYKFRQGGERISKQALADWQALAESRRAMVEALKEDKAKLEKEVAQMELHLDECRELRDDFAKLNLRLQAREKIYHTSINRLERMAGLPPTDFEPLPKVLGND